MRRLFGTTAVLTILAGTGPAAAQRTAAPAAAQPPVSAPVSEVAYTVTFDEASARQRTARVSMRFSTVGDAPVLLSLPAWTPGAYELTWFARWVTNFGAVSDGRALHWEKADHDTWRITPAGARSVTVTFDYVADSLDNAIAWSQPDFLFFNGTTVFLYPEGRPLDYAATVRVETVPTWRVATGMPSGGAARTYRAGNYHDLVDFPFFVGRFDLDSTQISGRWTRLATYPVGSIAGPQRTQVWDQLRRLIPPQVAVFGDVPWDTYTVMQITDESFLGASGLEHQNSHVNVISPTMVGHRFMPSLYAHEIFHAWNVKRLRPAELWPYRYDREQPTKLLWISEGITDYYADLSEVRGGTLDSVGFLGAISAKINDVENAPAISLEDASLETWIKPVRFSPYVYYPKGALAGMLLDITIRDASDNRRSLDDVMRQLYSETYRQGRGFTSEDWWRVVSANSGGRSFADFHTRYIDGREAFPYERVLPLAGLRLAVDSLREPRLGVTTMLDSVGIVITEVEYGTAAAESGLREGDYLIALADIAVGDQAFGSKFRNAMAARREGETFPVRIRRGGQMLNVDVPLRQVLRTTARVELDPTAGAKALRIRAGILSGTTQR